MTPELQQIHDTSMAILNKTGMIFRHRQVRAILSAHGVRVSGKKVFFTEKEILDWVAKAPDLFRMKAPNPDHDIIIGGDHLEFAPGYGAPKVVAADGSVRNGTVQDYITFLKLVQVCDHFHLNGGPLVQPDDIPVSASLPAMVYLSHCYSDKCLIVPNGPKEDIQLLMEMLSLIYGESFRQGPPTAITIINPISPLQMDENALDIILLFARNHQPLIITAVPMAGTTGPMTLAGSVALANAEVLAAIAAHQMINPGAPIVYGARASIADMRTGASTTGNPERTLCSIYCCRLAKAYDLPCRSGGAENDAATVNAQSGYESMMNMMIANWENINIVIHAAGTLGGFGAMSVEKLFVDMEIIGMVKRMMTGMEISSNSLALEVIEDVGPAGNFLMHEHTFAHCRTEARLPLIGSRGVLGDQTDRANFNETIEKAKENLLEQYMRPASTQDSVRELRKLLQAKEYPVHLLPIP
jgi:trimethylamine--corrinoid protein Co-methyltransferase